MNFPDLEIWRRQKLDPQNFRGELGGRYRLYYIKAFKMGMDDALADSEKLSFDEALELMYEEFGDEIARSGGALDATLLATAYRDGYYAAETEIVEPAIESAMNETFEYDEDDE